MPNLEDQLNKIKLKDLDPHDQEVIWQRVMFKRNEVEQQTFGSVLIDAWHQLTMKQALIGALALVFVFGSAGVVSASNQAGPGDALFGLDLAVEKARLGLAADERDQDLKLKFASERLDEIGELTADLSLDSVSEVEVDVFTNETVVKVEGDGESFIYTTQLDERDEIVADVAARFSLTEDEVNAVLNFEVENRSSRAEDKDNGNDNGNNGNDKGDNIAEGLVQLEALLVDLNDEDEAEIRAALATLLDFLGDDTKLEIETDEGEIEIENEDGQITIEIEDNDDDNNDSDNSGPGSGDSDDDQDDNRGHGNDADGFDEDNPGQSNGNNDADLDLDGNIIIDLDDDDHGNDVREDDNEVFCDGEWRDPEDCEDRDDDNDDDNDDNDNSGSGGGDDDDDDNSGSGDGDNDEDNDSSGSGSGSSRSGNSGSGSGDDD